MKNQSAIDYCQGVKNEDILIKKEMFKMPIQDDNSELISLTKENFEFVFEPSFMEGYQYRVREALTKKLERINTKLIEQNKVLYIRSVWRSHQHQREMRLKKHEFLAKLHSEKTKDQLNAIVSHFIAPEKQSMHHSGGAVDALIFDRETKQILNFGSNNGDKIDLDVHCYPFHPNISETAKKNRKLLIGLFEQEGFVVDLKEFWHFDYGNVAWAAIKQLDNAIYGPVFC
jgi:D-alanyl-D-alanine dipeptidase